MKTISRIHNLFNHNKAFVAYLTAGDGGMQKTLDNALALIKGGVNMIEIGLPFSDPIADGPVIQRAAERALASGTTLQDIVWLIKEIRLKSDIPLILFSYTNPILAATQYDFLHKAKHAGVDGLLLVDCPLEESNFIKQQCNDLALDLIYVITSTTPLSRIQEIARCASGFLYYACRKGTTGMHQTFPADFEQKIQTIKTFIQLPIVVGFGISTREMSNEVLKHADGVVIGSFFVKALEDGATSQEISKLAKTLYG